MAKVIIFNIIGLTIALAAIAYLLYAIFTDKINEWFVFGKKKKKEQAKEMKHKEYALIEDNTEETVLLCEDGTEFHYKKFIEE